MPVSTNPKTKLEKLQKENRKLRAENKQLKNMGKQTEKSGRSSWRKVGAVLFGGFAVALLIAGSVLFWAGNTVVKTDRFVDSTAPIIQDTVVQNALAQYTTEQLYANVDIEKVISEALPPKADFIVPTIAAQLETYTQTALNKVLASPKFQEQFNTIIKNAHTTFIAGIEKHGSDGVFDINELYQELSVSLSGSRLSFLADRKLPNKIGGVQLVNSDWIGLANNVITNIDTWRTLTILLFFVAAASCVYMSYQRRLALIRFSLISAVSLFISLVALRLGRELAASSVDSAYSEAAGRVAQIILNPLAVQILTMIGLFLIIAFVAWVGGSGKGATKFRERINQLLSGKIHQAIFKTENSFTKWLGKSKRAVQIVTITFLALTMLFIRLTPKVLLSYVLLAILLFITLEVFAAAPSKSAPKK